MDAQKFSVLTGALMISYVAYKVFYDKAGVDLIKNKGLMDNPYRLYQSVWVDLRPGVYSEEAIRFGKQLKQKVADCIASNQTLPNALR